MMQCAALDEMRMFHQELADVTAFVADRHAAVRSRLEQELGIADSAARDDDRLLRSNREEPFVAGIVTEVPQARHRGA